MIEENIKILEEMRADFENMRSWLLPFCQNITRHGMRLENFEGHMLWRWKYETLNSFYFWQNMRLLVDARMWHWITLTFIFSKYNTIRGCASELILNRTLTTIYSKDIFCPLRTPLRTFQWLWGFQTCWSVAEPAEKILRKYHNW